MEFTKKMHSTLLCLAIGLSLSTAPARAITAREAAIYTGLVVAAHSIFTYCTNFPTDTKQEPNEYEKIQIRKALNDLAHGRDIKNNLALICKFIKSAYVQGLCGHKSVVGSPRFNEKTGITEMPFIDARGVYGYIGDKIEPVAKTASFLTQACLYGITMRAGYYAWLSFAKPSEKASMPVMPTVGGDNATSYDQVLAFANDHVNTFFPKVIFVVGGGKK